MLFEQEFEGKKRMSIQDVIDCLNRDAHTYPLSSGQLCLI